MKQLFTLFTLAAIVSLNTSCNSPIPQNRANIAKIETGMTKQQVLDIMGEPLKFENYHRPNIWFYYTQRIWMDGIISQDECTPILFDKLEMVEGWGFDYYKKHLLFR